MPPRCGVAAPRISHQKCSSTHFRAGPYSLLWWSEMSYLSRFLADHGRETVATDGPAMVIGEDGAARNATEPITYAEAWRGFVAEGRVGIVGKVRTMCNQIFEENQQ